MDSGGNELFIGPEVSLKGEISDCDTLVVAGTLEASMDSRHIDVAEGGVLIGEIAADTARVAGRFEGSLSVRQHLDVLKGGMVCGTVHYRSFSVEDGGSIDGPVRSFNEETNGAK